MTKKLDNLFLLVMVALMYTTICMETDIYVPAFPDMKVFFSVTAETIQHVLSYNFIGICLGSLVFGPLSDSFGRKRTLLIGLVLFTVASWGCLFFNTFDLFLLSRFIQGIGAAAPMVITFAMILEKYDPTKVAQLCGGLNLFIVGVMAAAPIVGSYLNIYFGWKANFIVIAVLATCSLFGSFFLAETLDVENRTHFNVLGIVKNYGKVLTSFPYMAATCICFLLFAGMIVFVSNLSLIFIENLGVPKSSYGFYQATPAATFAIMSFLSIWIIAYFGTTKTKYAGLIFAALGAVTIVFTASFAPQPLLISAVIVIYAIGVTLASPIYGTEAANIFPEMRGIATGMNNALRHITIASVVGIGSYTFDGSMKPVALIIAMATVATILLALGLVRKEKVGLLATE